MNGYTFFVYQNAFGAAKGTASNSTRKSSPYRSLYYLTCVNAYFNENIHSASAL